MPQVTSVLFVCLGNICRSPLAEGVFSDWVSRRGIDRAFRVDSAGTGSWHVGEPPDRRSVAVAKKNGIDISAQRSRQLALADFTEFDWIVVMDEDNLRTASDRAPAASTAQLVAFMDYVDEVGLSGVPDPYYGGPDGFDNVFALLNSGMPALLKAMGHQER